MSRKPAKAPFVAGGIVLVLVVLFLVGPRASFTPEGDLPRVPADLGELERWLAESEAQVPDLVPGAEKLVVWADPENPHKTTRAVVYIHGFTSSRQEIDPIPRLVAESQGANLFYTRFPGNGRLDPDSFGEAGAAEWYQACLEALAVGLAIGEEVILLSTSTGVTVSAVLTQEYPDSVLALVGISPNFGPAEAASWITVWPWGRQIGSMIMGPYRSSEPTSELHGRFWTMKYPSGAIPELMSLVDYAVRADFSEMSVPLLQFTHDGDRVVDARQSRAFFEEWGSRGLRDASAKQLRIVQSSQDPGNHVIGGAIRSPDNSEYISRAIIEFLNNLEDG